MGPDLARIQSVLDTAVEKARRNHAGAPAAYIPELANVPLERLETHGPKPANPLINSGAIALCGHVRGHVLLRELSRNLGWHFPMASESSASESPPSRR